jgi:mRNA-degrading endonuclease toxin of MazEF toxin-antitoxin module
VKCEQILTVAKARLLEPPLGRLSPEELRRVEDAILVSLGIDR